MIRRSPTLVALALTAVLTLTLPGCANRLSGPNYAADDPAWVAEGIRSSAPAIEVQHRIIMIGDAGYFLEDDPTLADMNAWATDAASSSVVFLGDNIYNDGLTDDDRERGERILSQQLDATLAPKIFIPGNHDWGLLPRNMNARAIENQQRYVDSWDKSVAEFIPKEGCMGPMKRILSERDDGRSAVVLIALDPTPWINPRLREHCPTPETQEGLLDGLDAMLSEHRDDFVVVASHYPMLTGGPHGGLSYGVVADMIVTPLGWMMGGLLNTYEPTYADWIERTQQVLRRNPPEVYAAGHDHNLQLLKSDDVAGIYVVSGAGARDRVSTVTDLPETVFAHAAPGFVVLDIGTFDGRDTAVLRIVEQHPGAASAASAAEDPSEPVFEMPVP